MASTSSERRRKAAKGVSDAEDSSGRAARLKAAEEAAAQAVQAARQAAAAAEEAARTARVLREEIAAEKEEEELEYEEGEEEVKSPRRRSPSPPVRRRGRVQRISAAAAKAAVVAAVAAAGEERAVAAAAMVDAVAIPATIVARRATGQETALIHGKTEMVTVMVAVTAAADGAEAVVAAAAVAIKASTLVAEGAQAAVTAATMAVCSKSTSVWKEREKNCGETSLMERLAKKHTPGLSIYETFTVALHQRQKTALQRIRVIFTTVMFVVLLKRRAVEMQRNVASSSGVIARSMNKNESIRIIMEEQLEVQRHLQKRLEAQRKYLQSIQEKAYQAVRPTAPRGPQVRAVPDKTEALCKV
ncbi:unnamed protein product [Miscanthus lutarioriparius]|uniref:MYB-CC type transcription factor LHEQLE-containing domain-containing protein n=1 Tax=Miscanthus lutarioriparius TaxID=422564 RepID=A0A811RZW0_9POAL|nr:unnamed protein product [Miscanthus lutarioriparius]